MPLLKHEKFPQAPRGLFRETGLDVVGADDAVGGEAVIGESAPLEFESPEVFLGADEALLLAGEDGLWIFFDRRRFLHQAYNAAHVG